MFCFSLQDFQSRSERAVLQYVILTLLSLVWYHIFLWRTNLHGKVRGCDFGRQRTASQVANEKSIFQEWPFAGVSGSAALLVVKLVCLQRRTSMHPMRDRTPPFVSGTSQALVWHRRLPLRPPARRKLQSRCQQATARAEDARPSCPSLPSCHGCCKQQQCSTSPHATAI